MAGYRRRLRTLPIPISLVVCLLVVCLCATIARAVEMSNVLNRVNVGPANGSILPTGQAVGFTEKLLPRLVTAGLRVDFE